jgi:hypothetical protein
MPFGGFKVRFITAESGRVDSLAAGFWLAGDIVFSRQ